MGREDEKRRRPIWLHVWMVPLLLACVGLDRAAAAHPLAPSLLEIVEVEAGVYTVLWRTPALRASGVELEPVLPPRCQARGEAAGQREPSALVVRWTVDCGPEGLVGQVLSVRGLDASRTSALVRIESLAGRRSQALLRDAKSEFLVASETPTSRLALDYARLGFEHILLGSDHLLFVLGLLLLIRGRRPLVLAITSFTLGHSLTLALATFDLLRIPAGWVESGIALSLVFVAVELTRTADEAPTFLQARPWVASFSFGLLHGLGFAAVMRESGLPADEIPFALLTFNLGIELGQLAFVGVVLALIVGGRLRDRSPWSIDRIGAYAIGSLAVFWILVQSERFL